MDDLLFGITKVRRENHVVCFSEVGEDDIILLRREVYDRLCKKAGIETLEQLENLKKGEI